MEMKIRDVAVKTLVRHQDERGFFQEIIRASDAFFGEGFAQWSLSRMHPGVIKAWHYHQKQVDWWFVPKGNLKAVLYDRRPESPTFGVTQEFLMGEAYEPFVLRIPPGVLHGCRVIGEETELFYITSEEYDGSDEFRVDHDDPEIGYDWTEPPPVR
jgi:dTDP-4-dehydrorhamnose 3,5-epimerase